MEERDETRLSKLLAARGIASRREAEAMIREGRVTVNGQPATLALGVDPVRDHVRVDGKPLPEAPPHIYLLLHKPKGYVSGRDEEKERKSALDLLGEMRIKVEPAGRLDFDSEGALVLTNDGDLLNKLQKTSAEISMRWLAKVYRTPDAADIALLEGGLFLDDGKTKPAKVRVLESTDTGNAWVEITLSESRNRLVRRMFAQIGHPVSKLRRESFATISIRGLERGEVRPLTKDEIRRLREVADGNAPSNPNRFRYKKGFAKPKPKKVRGVSPKKAAADAAPAAETKKADPTPGE